MASWELVDSFRDGLDLNKEPEMAATASAIPARTASPLNPRDSDDENTDGSDCSLLEEQGLDVSFRFIGSKFIQFEDGPLLSIVRDLRAQANLPPLANPASEKANCSSIIEMRVEELLLVVPGLKSLLMSSEVEPNLKTEIEVLLGDLWSPWPGVIDRKPAGALVKMLARRDAILESKEVSFSDLGILFLPGLLGYCNVKVDGTGSLEGCWIVQSRQFVVIEGLKKFDMSHLRWVPDPTRAKLLLVSFANSISHYTGKAAISTDIIRYVPFDALPDPSREATRDRLVERGKKFVEFLKSLHPGAFWGIQGLVWRRPWREAEPSRFRVGDWSSLTDQTNCRVIIGEHYLRPLEDGTISLEHMPIDGAVPTDVFMACVPSIRARALPNLEKVFIPCDGWKPVIWREVPTRGHGSWVGRMISDRIRRFERRCEKAIADIDSQPRRFVCVVRGDEEMGASTLGESLADVAESFHKPFINVDILNYQNKHDDPFRRIELALHLAEHVSALVYLENAAPLMARRTFDQPKLCGQITAFRRLLQKYQCILFVRLEKDDQIDVSFRKLGIFDITPESNPWYPPN